MAAEIKSLHQSTKKEIYFANEDLKSIIDQFTIQVYYLQEKKESCAHRNG